ncbi:hypothetical protein [Paenibacillus taichungensis]
MTERVLKEPEYMTCLNCDTSRKVGTATYYEHNNPLVGTKYYPLCKKCIKQFFTGDEDTKQQRIKTILQQLNRPWIVDKWIYFKEDWGQYIKHIASFHGSKTFLDSEFSGDHNQEEDDCESGFSEKWRGKYSIDDINFLNGYLDGLMNDFKIINTSHLDYAKKISKASLHMDKCFEEMQNGESGADKKYETSKKIFDDLSKSANFAESSRSKDNASGSLSKIVDTVENGTYVYQHVPFEQDLYDRLLENQKHVEKSL